MELTVGDLAKLPEDLKNLLWSIIDGSDGEYDDIIREYCDNYKA